MAVSNNAVARVLLPYLQKHPAEVERLRPLILACVVGSDLVTAPTTSPAHVTCGMVAVRADGRVLQLRHPLTRRWAVPWGHIHPADGSLLAGALRELCAQTGIVENAIIFGSADPVDVEAYVTPDGELCCDEPRVHFEVTYLVFVPEAGWARPAVPATAMRWTTREGLVDRLAKKVGVTRFPVDLFG